MQSSFPAGWLAFTGRELNPLDRYKRFQITFSFPFSGFILAQGKFHGVPPNETKGIPSWLMEPQLLHCALMFAALMIGHHFSISAF
jgi:hypothetical protein